MSLGGNPRSAARSALPEPRSRSRFNWTSLLFTALVVVFCLWALSLPLFPTQDGPIHKYYVHVLASLLSGSHAYADYSIRRPFPPYAIHYLLLLGLTRFLSFDLAEKLLVCIILLTTAYSFRFCARSLGPSGSLLSLCAVPLLLHWSLMMGFLNYSLGVGLFFLAAGLWIRAAQGQNRLWLLFVMAVVLLTLTHPVPLLLLIAFCGLDLAVRMLQDRTRRRPSGEGFRLGAYRWQMAGWLAACLSFLYPLASADRSRSISNLHSTFLHKSALISSLVLAGISPFDTRSHNLLINSYRLGLYAILLGCLGLAAAAFREHWRARRLGPGDSLLVGSIVLLAAIPILPPAMNGSDYFAARLMIFPWLGAIAAASGFSAPHRLRFLAPAFALLMAAVTLAPAEIFVRPVSRQLAELEAQPLPGDAPGLAILEPAMLKAVRTEHQLGFNPYVWSGALPFLHGNHVMLNSPWLDLTIMPLRAAPGAPLLVNWMASPEEAERLINGNIDLSHLSDATRSRLLQSSRLIVFIATPPDLRAGVTPLTGAVPAGRQPAQYACAGHTWYLVCTL
ncbi:MAG TPA: hypothetical protein VGR96_04590 [Acidobacteriaceae bacterium]|nr:hypothetical protein [Acidobacteriaceae bacterium]